ncbi:MAG: WD40/YVTN/BNR-like repeat-containing protein [Candidatus Zixiibacteriota bacterium]
MTYRIKIASAVTTGVLLILMSITLLSCSEEPAGPPRSTLVVEPTSLTQTTICNQGVGARSIDVRSSGEKEVTFTATNSETWLRLTKTSDTTPSKILVNFNVGSLDIGVYVDTIVITSPQTSNAVKVEVQLTIASLLTVSTRVIMFRGLALASNPAPQEIVLGDTCETGYSYTITNSQPWLSFSPKSGMAPDTIVAEVDITGLPIGVYNDNITIESPQAVNSPLKVVCTLTVSSWLPQDNVIEHDLRGVTFVDEHHGWAVGIIEPSPDSAGYIITTSDDGQHWGYTGQPFTSEKLGDVIFVDVNNGWVVGSNGYILHTSNGGASWSKQTSGTTNDLWGVTFVDPDTGWAVGRVGIILHTTDGGDSWEPQSSNTDKVLSAVTFVTAG